MAPKKTTSPKKKKRKDKRRAKKKVKAKRPLRLRSNTPFGRSVLAKVRQICKGAKDTGTLVDTFVDVHKLITNYHRAVKKKKGEAAQEPLIPDTTEISMLWRVFLKLQEDCKDRYIPFDIEFAPFLVYGRTKEDRLKNKKKRWDILDEFDYLPLKSMSSFVTWAKGRRKRVVTLYLNLKRDHIMAMMFKPEGCCDGDDLRHVGLHKFDPNAAKKSHFDTEVKQEEFPDVAFYTNTSRIQGFQDFTCFFWCMHWILWKMTSSARFSLARERAEETKTRSPIESMKCTTLDSFRSPAYKKWVSHIHSYICSTQAMSSAPTSLAMLLMSDAHWLHQS